MSETLFSREFIAGLIGSGIWDKLDVICAPNGERIKCDEWDIRRKTEMSVITDEMVTKALDAAEEDNDMSENGMRRALEAVWPTADKLIEVTPAMIVAGVYEAREYRLGDSLEELVEEIYRMMELERRSPPSPPKE